jgi:hypothetical protein
MRSASTLTAADTSCEPGFRGVICASFGSTDALAEHDTGGRPRKDLRFISADPQTLANLASALDNSCIGVRLILAGPPADIHAAAAAAARCGMLDEEMTLVCEEDGPRVIFCGHCHATTTTVEPAGSEVECRGCATILATTDHFSRRVGGYLGFSAYAEEAS